MAAAITRSPHTLSQVVQRAFTMHRRLVRYSVLTGDCEPVTTREMGATMAIPIDRAPKFERKWQQVERRIPFALEAIRDGTALGNVRVAETIRDCLAMHMARTLDIIAGNEEAWRQARDQSIASIAGRPSSADSFRARRGLEPVGPDALEAEARTLYDEAVAAEKGSSHTAEAMLEWYRDARTFLGGLKVEIGRAVEGEFLISDAPAQAIKFGAAGVGVIDGTAWRSADTILMPIDRRFTIGVSRTGGAVDLPQEVVDELNRGQILAAHDHVAWHPDAELRAFADGHRSERRARVPILPPDADLDVTHFMPGPDAWRRE
jgi:hypothetical protein